LGTRANRSGRQDIFRPIDSEVYDEQNQNVALSKSGFAAHVSAAVEKFGEVNFDQFRHIETVMNRIIREATALIDLPFCGLASFLATLEGSEPRRQLRLGPPNWPPSPRPSRAQSVNTGAFFVLNPLDAWDVRMRALYLRVFGSKSEAGPTRLPKSQDRYSMPHHSRTQSFDAPRERSGRLHPN